MSLDGNRRLAQVETDFSILKADQNRLIERICLLELARCTYPTDTDGDFNCDQTANLNSNTS